MILASDFDDTLYILDNEEINYKNAEQVKRFVRSGNSFCIITIISFWFFEFLLFLIILLK